MCFIFQTFKRLFIKDCPRQEVKLYPSGVRLDNRKVFRAPSSGTNCIKCFFLIDIVKNTLRILFNK